MNGPLVLKIENGKAKLYGPQGQYILQICDNAVSGVVAGDQVHVTVRDGKVKVYGTNGAYIRSI